ncbi:MAG: tetratricopeptide repeat protein [Nitrosomonadaceae bacterium]
MSLLLEALKKAERDKPGKKELDTPVQGNAVGKEATAKLFSDHTSGQMLELVPENTPSSSDIPKQQTETESSQNRTAAQNIFLAKQDQSSRINIGRVGKWLIFSGILLIVMIGGAYYVWQETTYVSGVAPQSNEFKLGFVRQKSKVPPVSSQAKTITSSEPGDLGKTSIVSRSVISSDKVDGDKVSASLPEKNTLNTDIIVTSASLPSDVVEKSSGLSASEIQEGIQNSAGINSYSSKNPIEIKRNQTKNGVSEELKAAYQAYITGDLEIAKQYYLEELETNPRNKDVLLGLAAIATRLQLVNDAQAYYLRILELDPRDSSAIAGMAGLVQADPIQTESRLKNLLAQQPDAAALHFALGNNHVTQLRWAEAQQSFFRALSIDPANADYTFNLAVSLDHLKKNELATKYYREALVLADKGPVGFKEAQIIERLKELTK